MDYSITNRLIRTGVRDLATGTRGGLFGAGGRFKGGTDPIMEKFNESLWFDKRMWAQDIRGSVAYAKAIGMVGIITNEEVDILIKGLAQVHKEWEEGKFVVKAGDEGTFDRVVFELQIHFSVIQLEFFMLLKDHSLLQFSTKIGRHSHRKRATSH